MESKGIIWFKIFLVWGVLHTIRDTFQVFNVKNFLTEIGTRKHQWCGTSCDYIVFPLEIFIIIASTIVIKRKRIGLLGLISILSLIIFIIMWLWK